jgi:hypothetical protein
MRARRSVAYGIAHYDWDKPVLATIDGAGANASTGGDASDKHRIHAKGSECGGQRGPEESTGILLGN